MLRAVDPEQLNTVLMSLLTRAAALVFLQLWPYACLFDSLVSQNEIALK